jgi:hypothetical protein
MKKCKDCCLEKPLDLFYEDKKNRDSRQGFCKDCSRLRVRRWYAAHREKSKPRKNARVTTSKGEMLLGKNKNAKWRQHMEDKCRRCRFIPEDACQLTIDHIDRNKDNSNVSNLQTMCANCHNLKTKIELTAPEKLLLLNLVPSTS